MINRNHTIHQEVLSVACLAVPTDCSWEPNLFYVTLIIAKDELYVSCPMMNPKSCSGDIICRPSQFLDDFPQDLIEEWNVGNDNPWSDDEPF